MQKELKLAWLAGLFDGEGCVYARLLNKGKGLEVRVTVESVSKPMIERVEEIYREIRVDYKVEGGRMRPKSTRPASRIIVRKLRSVVSLLTLVQPYLVVKKPECDEVLSFLDDYLVLPRSAKPSIPERVKFIEQIKSLKRTA